ncbi:unnamed protein product [Paramecium pentaurelia]|uniref:Uncharacterized protein n=1 Tax=Paramecium pentaurelia TaxID=43138 RepID=A0A8S1YHY9_9CILI|nr:unnamed protein product [Paramecium pentaurelia]CAD8213028.1 unnamed protein product [Paramecium pentaurelia]
MINNKLIAKSPRQEPQIIPQIKAGSLRRILFSLFYLTVTMTKHQFIQGS